MRKLFSFNTIFKSVLFFLLLSNYSFSQTYSFDNYTVQDGIVQSNVAATVQDNNGDIWLGTESGVSRFNGKTFQNYSTDDGLADNNVTEILLDKKGSIWFGHANGGLTKYNGNTFESIQSEFLPKNATIFSLYQDTKGRMWISTAKFGAILIQDPYGDWNNKNNCKGYTSKDGLSEFCFSIFDDQQGNIWFRTDVGIKILNTENKFDFFRAQGLTAYITSFFCDKRGLIWLGFSDRNISTYDTKTKTIIAYSVKDGLPDKLLQQPDVGRFPSCFVNTFTQDDKGNVWAAIWDNGVVRFNSQNKKFTSFNSQNGLSINKIKCINHDREGNILFGTWGNGLAIFKGEKFTSFTKTNGIINNQVWAIVQDKKGRYWWGTNEGISIYDPSAEKEKAITNISKLGDGYANSIRALTTDKNGHIWIGTWGGKVIMYDIEKEKFIINQQINDATYSHVSCITLDRQGKLWIGTPEGITVYDHHSVKTYRTVDGLSSNDVTCIFSDRKGNIWIGTKQRGITKFKDGKFTHYDKTNGLNYLAISCITENKHGELWVGTEGGGLFLYRNNSFSNFKIKDGLNSDFIISLNVDEQNNLWIGSNNGLNKFDYSSNVFSSYSKFDGFSGIETKSNATYKDTKGNLWFGTVNGVYKYSATDDTKNILEPIVKITRLKVNLKDYLIADT
ncbi:MAG: hypothetical protein H0W84_08110, partial [Bacteroidetes bacterium]|nr:hypothetical protein [Bacteroidota bacterium]